MTDYTPTTEAVESLGEDIQAYLVMDGVYLDHEITRNVARCILSDPDWAGVVAEESDWEYALTGNNVEGGNWVVDVPFDTLAGAEAYARGPLGWWLKFENGELVRRRKAGPWVPVEP